MPSPDTEVQHFGLDSRFCVPTLRASETAITFLRAWLALWVSIMLDGKKKVYWCLEVWKGEKHATSGCKQSVEIIQ